METMDRYTDMDFASHNREVKAVWEAWEKGRPLRMPMITGISDRYFVLGKETNPRNVSFYDYSHDKALMFDMQRVFARWRQFNILGDHEMGVPETGYTVNVDFQNYYEAAWLGCEVRFPDGEVPYAVPLLKDDSKNMLFDRGLPDPFGGFMAKAREYYDYFCERSKTALIEGQKIGRVGAPFMGLDGMFTLACEIRGADNLCVDMLEDPDFYHALMEYLTQASIIRIKAWRAYIGEPEISESFGFADDSIMLLSKEMYRDYVLPYHKKLAAGISAMQKRGGAHLCGDAARHFSLIRDELNVYTFDTGFPVAHRELCEELGPEVCIMGGPSVGFISAATLEEIDAESRRIIEAVKPIAPRFVFRDGNDLPPGTPLEKIEALYGACKKYGRF
jgi:uroporphyrinogen-III decarboxylase